MARGSNFVQDNPEFWGTINWIVIATAVLAVAKGWARMARPAGTRRGAVKEVQPPEATGAARSAQPVAAGAPIPDDRVARFARSDGPVHPGLQQLARLLARQAALRHRRRSLGCSLAEFAFALAIVALLLMACLFLASHLMGP